MTFNITKADGQEYVSVPIDDNGSFYKFYINYLDNDSFESEENERFILDLFSSNELYFSIPSGKKLSYAKETLLTFLTTYILDSSSPLYQTITDSDILVNGFLKTCYSPTNPLICAWSLPLTAFFALEDVVADPSPTPSELKSSSVPHNICSNLTYHSSEHSITSSTYPFANHIKDSSICTSPNFVDNNTKFISCPFFPSPNQKNCPSYSHSKNTVLNCTLTPLNTNSSTNLSLDYLPTINRVHHFQINDNTSNNLLVEFTYDYDSSPSYDELVIEVSKIFDEYVSCYSQDTHDLTPTNQTDSVSHSSYINSLLGV